MVLSSREVQSSVTLSSGGGTKLSIKGKRIHRFHYRHSLPDNMRNWVACRYASLYFCMCIDQDDNELEMLEIIHHFVEILDRYFGSVSLWISSFSLEVGVLNMNVHLNIFYVFSQVCELDLIFNFHKVTSAIKLFFGVSLSTQTTPCHTRGIVLSRHDSLGFLTIPGKPVLQ